MATATSPTGASSNLRLRPHRQRKQRLPQMLDVLSSAGGEGMRRRTRSRIRRVPKRGGAAACVFILAACLFSYLWARSLHGDGWYLSLSAGSVSWTSGLIPTPEGVGVILRGWTAPPAGRALPWNRNFGLIWPEGWSDSDGAFGPPAAQYILPLWLPFVAVGGPTAFLIWRDRRRRIPPGHCQSCGYNLTGNTSGICPECGTPIPKDKKEPEPTTDNPEQ